MKTTGILTIMSAILLCSGLNQALGQWTSSGIDIYNTNAGNVGIGNDSPGTLLYVAKNMGEPMITIRNLGGGGGATYSMVDDLSGADWKFKATTFGGFKIRDHANLLDVIVIEPGSAANMIYLKAGGNMGIGMNSPAFKLDVSADARINGVRVGRGGGNSTYNTTVGSNAFINNTSGSYNAAFGYQALFSNTNGSCNTGNGYQALYTNTTGYSNTAVGYQALYSGQANDYNTAIGRSAMMYACDDASPGQGSYNTAVGYAALQGSNIPGNNTGSYNTAIGSMTLIKNESGYSNIAIGYYSLINNTDGNGNIAIGGSALEDNTDGDWNTACGAGALYQNETGSYNVAIGGNSLMSNTSGTNNTAVGDQAALTNQTGTHNTCIGYYANVQSTALTNATAVGNGATADASNQVRLGNTMVTTFYCKGAYTGVVGSTYRDLYADDNGKIGYVSSSARYKENITDMEDVGWLYALRPVNFTYRTDENQITQFGLIAEEVVQVKPEFVSFDQEGRPETVSYSSLISPLLKAIQEQQAMIGELQKKVAALEAERGK